MRLINGINDNGTQILHLSDDNGKPVTITLRFMPAIDRWSMSVESTDINVVNIIVTNHTNLLWGFAETGSFGIACLSTDDVEPFQVDDFKNGRNELYILSEDDMESAKAFIAGYPEP